MRKRHGHAAARGRAVNTFNRPDELERDRLRRDAAYFTAVVFGGPMKSINVACPSFTQAHSLATILARRYGKSTIFGVGLDGREIDVGHVLPPGER